MDSQELVAGVCRRSPQAAARRAKQPRSYRSIVSSTRPRSPSSATTSSPRRDRNLDDGAHDHAVARFEALPHGAEKCGDGAHEVRVVLHRGAQASVLPVDDELSVDSGGRPWPIQRPEREGPVIHVCSDDGLRAVGWRAKVHNFKRRTVAGNRRQSGVPVCAGIDIAGKFERNLCVGLETNRAAGVKDASGVELCR